MTRITVLGGKGYIGRHLTAYLRTKGFEVWTPERGSKDIFNLDLGRVIYAVGLTADFRSRPFDTLEAHTSYLGRVLRDASFTSLLYISSTRVYARCNIAEEESPIIVQPSDPSDLYNLSKLMGESLALNCGREGIRIARLSNVVGGSEPSNTFLATLIRDAKAGSIRLLTAADSRKDYIHIEDAVQMLGILATQGSHSIYNVASGISISNADWAHALQKKFGCTVSVTASAPLVSFPRIHINRFVDEFYFQPRSAIGAGRDSF